MVPRYDSGFSSLLCAEDCTIFDNNEYGGAAEEVEGATWPRPNRRTHSQNQSSNGEILPLPSDEFLSRMIEQECHHLPRSDYLKRLRDSAQDLMARNEAVDWIIKVGAHFSFGPLSTYLAIIYLDRFLSTYQLPKGKAWTMQLLSVACLSLAAKLEETRVPLSLDLQVGEAKFVFESRTVQRMELLVLSTLKWRMQSITPFSFIDYYLHTILDDRLLLQSSIVRSIQLLSITMRDIEFLEFRPSEIAAAVAISVSGETQTVDFEKAICLLTLNTQQERVVNCIKLIQRLSLICNGSVLYPHSPNGVLEIACLSYRSDETGDGLCESSFHGSPVSDMAKRRRLNRACDVWSCETDGVHHFSTLDSHFPGHC